MSIFRKVSFFFAIIFCFVCESHSSQMEDAYETEIDSRLPSSFLGSDILCTRMTKFTNMTQYSGNSQKVISVGNWELFAKRYWYEFRLVNCSCPQIPECIATIADWALMVPCLFGNIAIPPKIVYVHTFMLSHFYESTLRFMPKEYRFILLTGGADATIPENTGDARFGPMRGFSRDFDSYFYRILNDTRVIHWYSENKDINHDRFSTLPTGIPEREWEYLSASKTALKDRPLKIFSADRERPGGNGQWAKRGMVRRLCSSSSFCFNPKNESSQEIPRHEYLNHIASLPFIACVQGGGLDPSPKAWMALYIGTIPIMERNTLYDAYSKFPVAFVDNWPDFFNAPNISDILKKWIKDLGPYYEPNSLLRRQTIAKLRTVYWVNMFKQKYNDYFSALNVKTTVRNSTKVINPAKKQQVQQSSAKSNNVNSTKNVSSTTRNVPEKKRKLR